LADCCYACHVALTDAHSALGDARATAQLLSAYLHPGYGRPPLPEHLALLGDAQGVRWPARKEPAVAVEAQGPAMREGRREAEAEVHVFRTLATLLADFGVDDALTEQTPTGMCSYLELLAQALEDGQLSSAELASLGEVAKAYDLTMEQVMAGHHSFAVALAHRALEDGYVSKAEKADLAAIARMLELGEAVVAEVLDQAQTERLERHIADCKPLPPDWLLGEPLRVGDRVAFTGCDEDQRTYLEERALARGVRVMGNVSKRTALLVTDGTYEGNKAAAAQLLGTRIIHPDQFAVLVNHIQPPATR
jgi:DNA polymerase-3 subunit epsilon